MVVILNSDRGGDIRAVFRTEGQQPINIELTVKFERPGQYSGNVRAEIVRLIDDMRYCSSLAGDCMECNVQQVRILARRCQEGARLKSEDVTTSVNLADERILEPSHLHLT